MSRSPMRIGTAGGKVAGMLIAPYREALRTVTGRSAVPYGYTVTLWSSGAVMMHERGSPSVGDVFLFLAGALGAFCALCLAVRGEPNDAVDPSDSELVATGMLNVVGVSAAVGVAALIALIPSVADWGLASLAATSIYLGGCALQLAFVRRRRDTEATGSVGTVGLAADADGPRP